MKLPTLSTEDIEKLDNVFAFLKENKNTFINISTYCSQTIGYNDQLESSFANCLIENGLATPKTDDMWSQMITQEGLAFDSFKNEYIRQRKDKKKEKSKNNLEHHSLKLDIITKYFTIIGAVYISSDVLTMYLSKGKTGILSYLINLISNK